MDYCGPLENRDVSAEDRQLFKIAKTDRKRENMTNDMDQRARSKGDSHVVVAYIMLMFVILFGIAIGWVGHMILVSSNTQQVCNGQSN